MRFKNFLLTFAFVLAVAPAHAATLDYIFSGIGTGDLDGTAFDATFTATFIGDPSAVTNAGEFFNAVTGSINVGNTLTANFTGSQLNVLLNPSNPGAPRVGFEQVYGAGPTVSVEAVQNSSLTGYDLASTFPLVYNTDGTAVAPATFVTDKGNLDFTGISQLSFEAVVPSAVPLPGSLPLFVAAFLGLGVFGFMRRRRA